MIPFIWIRTDTSGTEAIVRIADINLEPAAVYIRLVPITGPDEDVRTRGTVRIMLTKVTGTSIILLYGSGWIHPEPRRMSE